MNRVKSVEELRRMRDTLRASLALRERSNTPDRYVQVKVSMAACGIAAGAKEIMGYFIEALERAHVEALVTQTDCMGFCHAEPTVEITLPGKEPQVFGHVNPMKADEIIEKYIGQGILVEGVL